MIANDINMGKKNIDSQMSIFWTSYSDLLTSLFFLMLVLYVVTFAVLKAEQNKYKADAEKLRRIQEIEKSVNAIDSNYFVYRPEFKKHILKVSVKFERNKSDMSILTDTTKKELVKAGSLIKEQVLKFKKDNIKYLVVIEGQSSKNGDDLEYYNYKLSYDRALALLKFWQNNNIRLGEGELRNCEIVIAGSGQYGEPREKEDESKNQRFLIHIIPKVGTL